MRRLRWPGIVAAVIVLSSCGSSGSTTPRSPLPAQSGSPSDGQTPAASEPLARSATPGATVPAGTPRASPDTSDPFVGMVVTTLADDGLLVRSEPGINDASYKFEPLLPLGTKLLVVDGPVRASGYVWYDVAQLSSADLPSGWIASASHDGVAWIARSQFDCPPVPTTIGVLEALPRGVGLACFARVPITVDARLLSCNCDIDGSWYEPSWFFLGSGAPDLLVDPRATRIPSDFRDWFPLNLDPAGTHPEVLPVGEVVRVTGMFDHPAADRCTETEMDGAPAASERCRLEFAVTHLVVVAD